MKTEVSLSTGQESFTMQKEAMDEIALTILGKVSWSLGYVLRIVKYEYLDCKIFISLTICSLRPMVDPEIQPNHNQTWPNFGP